MTYKKDSYKEKLNLKNMIHWQYVDNSMGMCPKLKKNEVYLINYDYFKGPMHLFHLLRKIAIFFDRCANKARDIIGKYSEHYDIMDGYKLPRDYFNP